MNFFDYIDNEAFFKPLTLKYRRVYYDCIQLLIEKTKELPVLYENDARDLITLYLQNAGLRSIKPSPSDDFQTNGSPASETMSDKASSNSSPACEVPSSDSQSSKAPSDKAPSNETPSDRVSAEDPTSESSADLLPSEILPSEILSLFRECGWLLPREIGRNGEYIVNLSPACRRFMDFLRKMTENSGEGMMSNRIFSMYEIMKSAFGEDSMRRDRPYMNILVPLIDNETELKNELADLKDSISGIMKAVIVFQDINSFGQFIMKDEMLDRFFSEYFFVKNNGLIPSQISYLKEKLRVLRAGEILEKMVAECADKQQLDSEEARERVENYFAELSYFLSVEYDDNMELIDRRINNYYNLANTRIMLMASSGMRLETAVNDFLNALSKLPESEQDAAMEKVSDCTRIISQRYLGYKSFEKRTYAKNRRENIGLAAAELSEEEKQRQTRKLFESAPNRYSVERVSHFLDTRMGAENRVTLCETNVRSKEEILMYAAAMLYAENEEFPYHILFGKDTVATEFADITDITITRKRGRTPK